MNASVGGGALALFQVARGAAAQARCLLQAEGAESEPGAMTFQSLLEAIGVSVAELPGPATESAFEPGLVSAPPERVFGPVALESAAPTAGLEQAQASASPGLLIANQASVPAPLIAATGSSPAPLISTVGSSPGPAIAAADLSPVSSFLAAGSSPAPLIAAASSSSARSTGILSGAPLGGAVALAPDVGGLADEGSRPWSEATGVPSVATNPKGSSWLAVPGDTELEKSNNRFLGSRDFLARVDAARVASEADANTSLARAANDAGKGTAQSLIAAPVDADGSGLRAYASRRPMERFGQRSLASAATALAVAGADSMSPGTSHGASPVYAPGAATPVSATTVAEKLHHWVLRGVQNAQLKLDAFGGGSVDVSISVMGQETIVDFRTDQPQARSLLLEAMPQLKELLEREGLVFSGGFVGESGPRDSGSQRQQGSRQDGRDGPAPSGRGVAAATAPAGRLPGAPGTSIDLFV